MLQQYLSQPDRIIDSIWFKYLGAYFSGRGVLTWDKIKGYYLEVPINRQGSLPSKLSFFNNQVIKQSDVTNIRIRTRHKNEWILIPDVVLKDKLDLIVQDRLSLFVPRIIISEVKKLTSEPNKVWEGQILVKCGRKPIFPDNIEIKETLNNMLIYGKIKRSGLYYKSSDGQEITGTVVDDDYIEFYYKLPQNNWTKAEAWNWAESAIYALSILLGEKVVLLQRQLKRMNRVYRDIRIQTSVHQLGQLKPLGHLHILDKDIFVDLTNFFSKNTKSGDICKKIFLQMIEASKQQTWEGASLLVSTILEATLRTLEEHPFRDNDRSFNIKQSFDKFCSNYFHSINNDYFNEIYKTYKRLRHRNAHPDWLYTETGSMSDSQREKTLNDIILLSRFYGCIILAIAGINKVTFPPVSNKSKL